VNLPLFRGVVDWQRRRRRPEGGRWSLWTAKGSEMDKDSYVYIMASARYGTLYIGVTADLLKRVWQHREGVADGFTKQYRIKQLVWFETHGDITIAIQREKILKKWSRKAKIELIQKENPYWRDLYPELLG
jgi:putative endonuclease